MENGGATKEFKCFFVKRAKSFCQGLLISLKRLVPHMGRILGNDNLKSSPALRVRLDIDLDRYAISRDALAELGFDELRFLAVIEVSHVWRHGVFETRSHGFQMLATGSLARLQRLIDALVCSDHQLLEVALQHFEHVRWSRFYFVAQKRDGAAKHRMQFSQSLYCVVRLLGQQHFLHGSEQPVDKSLEILYSSQRPIVQRLAGRHYFESFLAKRVARALVFGKLIPQALHENSSHVLDVFARGILRNLCAPDLN